MKGTVESMIRTPIPGDNEDAFDVVIKLEGQDDHIEFRTSTYEERYCTYFAKPGNKIEIDITSYGRIRYMQGPSFTYTTRL